MLEAAANESRTSLSREIERRLLASLDGEDVIAAFGDFETYALCRLFAAAIFNVRAGRRWCDDPWAWREAWDAVGGVMSYFQPPGAEVVPDEHPTIRSMKASGLDDEMIEKAKAAINMHGMGMKAAHSVVAQVEGSLSRNPANKVADLRTIGEAMSARIATGGKGGDAMRALMRQPTTIDTDDFGRPPPGEINEQLRAMNERARKFWEAQDDDNSR